MSIRGPAIVFAVSSVVALAAQRPSEPFRVDVNYVEVEAIITDRDGRFVPDLQKDEFEILEDGKPQALAVFSAFDRPSRSSRPASASQAIEADVSTNVQPADGRLYVMVLDDVHTSATRGNLVKAAARRFVERHVQDGDLVAVAHTSGRAQGTQDFTASRARLARAIDQFTGARLPSPTLEKLDRYQQDLISGRTADLGADPRSAERAAAARATLLTLRELSDALAPVRGRHKAMLFVSEGIDYDINSYIANRDALSIADAVREAISAAARANVTIYSLDPRGLAATGDELVDVLAPPLDPHQNLGSGSLQDELKLAQDSLRVLAAETGGFAIITANDFTGAFDRIVAENSRHYVLGYYSTNSRLDGRFRKIDVRVRRPGLSVRARKGYVAAQRPASRKDEDRRKPAEVRDALNLPLPVAGLPLTVHALPLKGADATARVAVTIEAGGRGLAFARRGATFRELVELSAIALDYGGTVRASDQTAMTIELTSDRYARLPETGFRTFARLELPPGRFQLRIAARARESGLLGTVFHDLDVPDYSSPPFAMSPILLSSAEQRSVPTARLEPVKDLLPVVPSAGRQFTTRDELVVFSEVYDRDATPHGVDVTASVRAEDGRIMFQHHQENAAGGRDAVGGFGYVARVQLADLAPATYVLKVEAASRLAGRTPATREVRFTVTR